jgi:hypothetical protein
LLLLLLYRVWLLLSSLWTNCQTAISSEMERRLYRICKEQKITYITIAHRPALKSYHDQARKRHLLSTFKSKVYRDRLGTNI